MGLNIDYSFTTSAFLIDVGFLAMVIERYHFGVVHVIPSTKVIIVISRHSNSSSSVTDVETVSNRSLVVHFFSNYLPGDA